MWSAFPWAVSPRCISASDMRRARSLTVGGCGYGADPAKREEFRAEGASTVAFLGEQGMETFAARFAYGPTWVQLENKSPRAFAEFKRQLAEHSAIGSANTRLGVQRERPSLYDLKDQMKALKVPTLILTGDEDWPCLLPGILMKETIPSAALAVMSNCGHSINVEDPDQFNRIVSDFLAQRQLRPLADARPPRDERFHHRRALITKKRKGDVATPSGTGRFLRIGVVHCIVVFARPKSPKRSPARRDYLTPKVRLPKLPESGTCALVISNM